MSFANNSACRICSTYLLRLPSESAVSSRNLRRRSVALRVLEPALEVEVEGLGQELDPGLEVKELVPEPLLLEMVDLAESRLEGGLSEEKEAEEESLSNLAFMLLTLDLQKMSKTSVVI